MTWTELFQWAATQVASNQFLITAIIAGAAIWARSVPKHVWDFVYRNITVNLNVNNEQAFYENLILFIDEKRLDFFSRNYALNGSNIQHGIEEETKFRKMELTVGYGISVFLYKGRLGFIDRSFIGENSTGNQLKERANITLFTRNKDLLKTLISEVEDRYFSPDQIELYTPASYTPWRLSAKIYKRDMDSIFIEKDVKEKIISSLEWFLDNREWYRARGINYKFGIMLSGPPGTGKSSLIRAIASHFNKNIKYLSSSSNLSYMIGLAPPDILVCEDIDSFSFTKDREEDSGEQTPMKEMRELSSSGKLSEFLNLLDGALTPDGLIFIVTTNYPERIDGAILRKGRIDLHVVIDALSRECFLEMAAHLFDDETAREKLADIDYIPLTGSTIQGVFFECEGNIERFKEGIALACSSNRIV